MYLKILFTLILVFNTISQNAQESIVGTGGNTSESNGSVSYSIGQIAYTSNESSAGSITQGVQQPYEILTLSGAEITNIELLFSVYPNPTTSFVTLKILEIELTQLSFTLFDLQGKLLYERKVAQSSTSIDLESYESGIYILNILDQNKLLKSFKIIKK